MKEARRLLGIIPAALLAICTATTFEPVRAQEVPDPEIERVATAHQISTGEGTTVAIIDAGVDRFHPELSGRVLTTGWNFQDNNDDVSDVGDVNRDGWVDTLDVEPFVSILFEG
ncbi:MAG: hypothetical protein IID33_07490 [Planctomycetes bacterium]|nr:hypothetical protein [Planctomycetota bacterium]